MWIRAGRKGGERDIRGKQEKRIKAREQEKGIGRGLFRPGSRTVPLSIKVCLTQWMT